MFCRGNTNVEIIIELPFDQNEGGTDILTYYFAIVGLLKSLERSCVSYYQSLSKLNSYTKDV